MDMNHRKSEDQTFNSLSVAIGEAVCTVVEGTIATVQYVVGLTKGVGRHSPQCKSGENSEASLSLGSHTVSMNSFDKSCEQSRNVSRTSTRHSYIRTGINDETLTVGGNSRNGGSVHPRDRKRETTKLRAFRGNSESE
jgi:hypothetical protein